ncbi:transposase [Bradyrhizobium pachyrhizi]|uniref:transposase n=1 Tax=Bradyrhizobium pachyrhizi TaxID=280333 RepID=UPI003D16026F
MLSVMKRADRSMIADVVDALRARVRRRRWCDDVKAEIVAKSYAPGAVMLEVARRHRSRRSNFRPGAGRPATAY